MGNDIVQLEIEGHLAVLTINNPPANALSSEVYAALEERFSQLNDNQAIRACIITAAGERVFVGGADVKELQQFSPEQLQQYIQLSRKVFQMIEDAHYPVICALNGHAFGGGCELALACDIRVAHAGVKLGQPEVTVGVIPGAGGTQRLPRLIPRGRATWMLLSGEIIDARNAEKLGLIDFVFEADMLDEAKKMAAKLTKQAPLAVSAIKKAIRKGLEQTLEEGLSIESQLSLEVSTSEDAAQGYRAFLEKRPAHFIGR